MKFRKWIETQDPNRWGLPAAVIQYLTEWFSDRVIFSESKMSRVFWMKVSMSRQRFLDMQRIQDSNHTFDPGITRVLEALYSEEGASNTSSHGSGTYYGNNHGSSTVSHKGNDITREEAKETRALREESETVTYNNREHVKTKNGEEIHEHDAKPTDNYSQDSGKDKVAHIRSESTTVSNSGRHVTETEAKTAEKGTQANKSAPMTAVNLSRNAVTSGDAYLDVKSNSLGPQDWSSASSYSERGAESGRKDKVTEYYEGDNTVTRTEGQSQANYDDTEYGKKIARSEHSTDTTRFRGYEEKDAESGSETRDKTFQPYEDKNEKNVTSTIADVESSESGGSDGGSSNDSNSNTGHSRSTFNIYSGREGMTPQEAFASALKYLEDYPEAVYWLIGQLEDCFIGIIDDEYDEEGECYDF